MVSTVRSFLNWLLQQFQLKPGKPAIASSLRALISVLGPLLVGVWLGHPTASAIAIMAAWFVGLVNIEGVYRQKAVAKVAALISIIAMLLLANLVHGIFWLSVLTLFLVMFVAGLVNVFGQAVSSISLITSIMFIVALAKFSTFPNWSTVFQQCAIGLAGGTWSILVSLVIWQLRPYKPVIQSVANCYSALSQLVNAAKERVAHPGDRRAQLTQFLQAQDNFTQSLTTARDRWSAAWTVQQAANQSGNQLLILIEDTPSMANAVVTLVEQAVIGSDHPLFQSAQRDMQEGMEQLAAVLTQMSQAIANGKSSISLGDLDRAIEALHYQQQRLRTQLENSGNTTQADDYTAFRTLEQVATTLTRLVDQVHSDADLIVTLRDASRMGQADRRNVSPKLKPNRPSLASMLEPLRNNLTIHSVLFRHALRLAIVATLAEIVASLLQIPRGYWITLTAVVALRPNYGGTSQTTLQRVLGTVLGGVIGIAIVTLIHNPWIVGGCLLLLIITAVAVRPLSFSVFITLLTPAIILLLNVTSQGGWEIGILRIADSVAGGLLALLGSYLLFPRWERQQLPAQLETTIRANLAYFQQVIAMYLHPDRPSSVNAIAPLRRQAALENTNLSAAAQRLFSEPRHVQGDVEAITTLIFYIRRFFNSVTALAEHRQDLQGQYQCPDFKHFTDAIIQSLETATIALQHHQSPQPLPDLDRHLDAIHTHIQHLQSDRISTATATLQVIQERAPMSASLDQIAYEIKNIHSAIAHMHGDR